MRVADESRIVGVTVTEREEEAEEVDASEETVSSEESSDVIE